MITVFQRFSVSFFSFLSAMSRPYKGLFLTPTWLALLTCYFIIFYIYSTSNIFIRHLLHPTPADLFQSPSSPYPPIPVPPSTLHLIPTLLTNTSDHSLKSIAFEEGAGEGSKSQRASSNGKFICCFHPGTFVFEGSFVTCCIF